MADCLCDNLVIDSCPPYASEKSFREYIAEECNNCSGVVPVATTNANLKTAAEIDSCCNEIIINRGNQVVYSIDGGINWVETGVRRTSFAIGYANPTTFTANIAVIPPITSATAYIQEVSVGITGGSANWIMGETGNYLFHFDFLISPTAALANTNFLIEVYQNGVATLPSSKAMPHWVTSATDNLFHSMHGVMRIISGQSISFRYLSGTTFTSNNTGVYVDLFKISN
jgi:hypothetical protein